MACTTISSSFPADDHDPAFDKFSTLFSPSTPRASPILGPAPDPVPRRVAKLGLYSRASGSTPEFVSVSASEDPLGTGSGLVPPQSPQLPFPNTLDKRNSTLSFFEQFGENARVAVDKKRHGLLEELLMHEDDPLYWVATQAAVPPHSDDIPDTTDHTQEHSPEGDSSVSLLDVDDITTALVSTHSASSSATTGHEHRPSPSHSPSLRLPPVRAAPPVAVTQSPPAEIPSLGDEQGHYETFHADEHHISTSSDTHRRSSSSSNLSSLSRLVSSLRSTTTISVPRHPPLEGIFDSPRFQPSHPRRSESESGISSCGTSSTIEPHHHGKPKFNNVIQQEVHIKHGTPFSSDNYHRSPFASHAYTPPSGAPGYAGERYDWDRGFSEELEREAAMIEREEEVRNKSSQGNGNGKGERKEREREGLMMGTNRRVGSLDEAKSGRSSVGKGSGGVAEFIERRGGSVQLVGRKELTSVVLTVDIADLVSCISFFKKLFFTPPPPPPNQIRPHLPALARLPKRWTLLYSLDQHGISLKTLYSRCEAASEPKPNQPRSAGQLVVVKDERDGLFGVWMGKEGVKMGKGRESGYYGSGEWCVSASFPRFYFG